MIVASAIGLTVFSRRVPIQGRVMMTLAVVWFCPGWRRGKHVGTEWGSRV